MADPSPPLLRTTFNDVAELYDCARPSYPAELLTDLAALAQIGPRSRVLEIGCGTGQLTLPLGERGCTLVALDIGPELAAIARRKLQPNPSVEVVVSAFEDWPLPELPFDVVVSATAFHLLDPAVRVPKAARALRPGGALAIIATHHIAGGDSQFFVEVQECYRRWDPATPLDVRLLAASEIPLENAEVAGCAQFDPPILRRY